MTAPPLPPLEADFGDFVLRPLVPGDAAALAAALGDFEVSKWLAPVPHPYTLAMAQEWLGNAVPRGEAEGTALCTAIDKGGLAGVVALHVRDEIWNLGYWLAPQHHGQRIMSRAAAAMAEHAFKVLQVPVLGAGVFPGNERSARILAGLGFAKAGVTTVYCEARGQDMDHMEYVLTPAAWQRRRKRKPRVAVTKYEIQ